MENVKKMKTTTSMKMTKTMIENVPRKDKEIAGERGLLLIKMIRVAMVEAKEREMEERESGIC